MPGRVAGTVLTSGTCRVTSATSSTLACSSQSLPEMTMLALRMVPSSITFCSYSASNSERSVTSVTS